MTDDLTDPARAFDDLRREVSLGLRAIQGLAAEHKEMPDYSETLKAIDGRLQTITQAISAIAKSPAMTFTPENMAERFDAASAAARRNDSEIVQTAAQRMDKLSGQLGSSIAQVRSARDQRTWLAGMGGACFVAGIAITLLLIRLLA